MGILAEEKDELHTLAVDAVSSSDLRIPAACALGRVTMLDELCKILTDVSKI